MEIRVLNPITSEISIREVPDIIESVDDLRKQMLSSLNNLYQSILLRGFTSSATGTSIDYKYDSNFQLIYSKWANLLALDTTIDLVIFATRDGIVNMNRQQFIQFMKDAHQFEVDLFNNKVSIENSIFSANSVDELNRIEIKL